MSEIVLRIVVPPRMESEYKAALKRVVERFNGDVEYEAAVGVLSKSRLSTKQVEELSCEAKKGIARRHGVM